MWWENFADNKNGHYSKRKDKSRLIDDIHESVELRISDNKKNIKKKLKIRSSQPKWCSLTKNAVVHLNIR